MGADETDDYGNSTSSALQCVQTFPSLPFPSPSLPLPFPIPPFPSPTPNSAPPPSFRKLKPQPYLYRKPAPAPPTPRSTTTTAAASPSASPCSSRSSSWPCSWCPSGCCTTPPCTAPSGRRRIRSCSSWRLRSCSRRRCRRLRRRRGMRLWRRRRGEFVLWNRSFLFFSFLIVGNGVLTFCAFTQVLRRARRVPGEYRQGWCCVSRCTTYHLLGIKSHHCPANSLRLEDGYLSSLGTLLVLGSSFHCCGAAGLGG